MSSTRTVFGLTALGFMDRGLMGPALKPLAGLAVALALVAGAGPAAAQQGNLSGAWKGGYVGQDGADANIFDVTLRQNGTALSGAIVEINAIGNADEALFLTSTLTGSVANGAVSFVKTYDGSGGVSHSVSYTGQLDATGRRIRGVYNAGGATGQFEMVR